MQRFASELLDLSKTNINTWSLWNCVISWFRPFTLRSWFSRENSEGMFERWHTRNVSSNLGIMSHESETYIIPWINVTSFAGVDCGKVVIYGNATISSIARFIRVMIDCTDLDRVSSADSADSLISVSSSTATNDN